MVSESKNRLKGGTIMVYCDEILDEVHDAIFGNGCEPECDYEAKTINYNTDGDVFYRVNGRC